MNAIKLGSVLILDRDLGLAKILGAAMVLGGYKVAHSVRAREALLKLDRQKFQLIVLDPDLGAENANGFIAAVKNSGGFNSSIPFVLVTGKEDFELNSSLLPCIRSVLKKPFTLEEFWGAVALT